MTEDNTQNKAGWTCPQCGQRRSQDYGVDPCMGELPGVVAACCSHGGKTPNGGYILFENGVRVGFRKAYVESGLWYGVCERKAKA